MSCGWPDVQALQRQGRAVFVLDSGVYVLDEKFSHPGGAKVLSANSGEDISALFGGQAGGHVHTAPARRLLERYWVGKLVDHRQQADDGADDTSNKGLSQTAASQFSIDESKPLLAQVGRLGLAYDAWVHAPVAGQPRFFASDLAERLTKTRWWVVPMLWLPLAAAFLWRAVRAGGLPPAAAAALVVVGIVAWQLIEYSIHRWLFHLRPTQPLGIFLHFLLHGCHHKYPTDVERLVFPPLPASWAATLVYAAVHALLPQAAAWAMFGGILLGYVTYDTMHYLMHSGQLGGPLRSAHMHHHYICDTEGYGISSPLFDWVFHTAARKAMGA